MATRIPTSVSCAELHTEEMYSPGTHSYPGGGGGEERGGLTKLSQMLQYR